ncbi:hypothetical protein CO2235_U770088 [Cupriavidus oxalaticus]|uniref:Uncharacterized protein n=1 Tax=Cupriavidus oxalaticus TaxID=96344 RepID=A0A375FP15_9BURK|nr:hypothetical protein CO2235_U770088 [Cupriavidus oxalaticus]
MRLGLATNAARHLRSRLRLANTYPHRYLTNRSHRQPDSFH